MAPFARSRAEQPQNRGASLHERTTPKWHRESVYGGSAARCRQAGAGSVGLRPRAAGLALVGARHCATASGRRSLYPHGHCEVGAALAAQLAAAAVSRSMQSPATMRRKVGSTRRDWSPLSRWRTSWRTVMRHRSRSRTCVSPFARHRTIDVSPGAARL